MFQELSFKFFSKNLYEKSEGVSEQATPLNHIFSFLVVSTDELATLYPFTRLKVLMDPQVTR